MRNVLLIIFFLLCSLTYSQSLHDFNWLEGTWKRQNENPNKESFESWERKGNTWIGIGVTIQNKDTVFIERLRIVEMDGFWNYTADVEHNETTTYFKINSYNEFGFVSENPNHDFPKKIAYKLQEGKMVVSISGNGKVIPFYFTKEE